MDLAIVAVWVIASIAIGAAAESRGRSGPGWFFLSLVISPVLAALILIAFAPIERSGEVYITEGAGHDQRRQPSWLKGFGVKLLIATTVTLAAVAIAAMSRS